MSRREEVERQFECINIQVCETDGYDGHPQDVISRNGRILEFTEVVDLLNAAYPTRYTPREEVTEGWWSCRINANPVSTREFVKVFKTNGPLVVYRFTGSHMGLERFTDFLRVPAWLVEGIPSETP